MMESHYSHFGESDGGESNISTQTGIQIIVPFILYSILQLLLLVLLQDYVSRIVDISYAYWIGLVERQQEDHWSWVDGTDFNSTPKFWDKGQSDDWDLRENGEDCGQLHESSRRKRKLWNDADCSLEYRYTCEAKA